MFDMDVLPPVSEVTGRDTAGLIEAMGAAARWEAATAARRLAAVAELFHRRLQEVDAEEREQWLIDGHEQVSAEVGCALGISRARAAGVIRVATSLFDRLPKVAAVFAAGRVDYRVVAAIVSRTELVLDDADVAVLDRALARQVHRWNRLSRKKLAEVLDACVLEIDRLAAKPARDRVEDREVGIGAETEGTAELWGTLAAPDAIAFDTRLEQLAATVCAADPRTKAQRRADAVGALSVGATRLACRCGQAECPTAGESAPAAPEVVITVLTDPAGQRGYIPGFGFLDAQALAAAMAAGAQQRSLPHPGDCGAPEPRYRPSAALANFVRAAGSDLPVPRL
ncbi:DUF222 domain-containing protein [[Mycobacterium] wendilense]|uniref:DUF222 domain-containing protein n=1 Tax=[Mycobacterium] wendilense TaxID=3064284 RepID=A0ABN9PA13_9MYCO|nr:DUF222 domain-containing protein [Mycolicibacterium sp. MU0050]CAJ1585803.1 DUF222 domain-containing protein [Mycolicibacterium sp. MU0050]